MRRYRFIHAERANYPVVLLCRVLGVARSAYYAWAGRGVPARTAADAALTVQITAVHACGRRIYGVPRVHATAQALIGDPDVDAVYIATPPSSHASLARQVAAVGKPCLVEKPMALNHGECVEMIEAFQQAKAPLWVAPSPPTSPPRSSANTTGRFWIATSWIS